MARSRMTSSRPAGTTVDDAREKSGNPSMAPRGGGPKLHQIDLPVLKRALNVVEFGAPFEETGAIWVDRVPH